ncbi:10038_t:CDS:2, partial [Cetraspora pellucida]
IAGKRFTVVNHPSKVYGLPDAHECINRNLLLCLVLNINAKQKPDLMNPKHPFLDGYKISYEDLLSRILIACADIIYFDLKHLITLNAFTLASSSNANKCSWHIVYNYTHFVDYRDLRGFVKKVAERVKKLYLKFIDIDIYKSHFSLHLLELAKKDRVKRPAISSIKKGNRKLEDYLSRTFSSEKPERKEKFQPIEDETALSVGASLVIAKYRWLEVSSIKKRFVNFQIKSYKACSICEIKHEKDQLYEFLQSNRCFILKYYWQKQYKPDYKGLVFEKVTEISAKPKREIVKRIADVISNPCLLVELSEMVINIEKLKDAFEAYPNFLSTEKITTLIHSSLET